METSSSRFSPTYLEAQTTSRRNWPALVFVGALPFIVVPTAVIYTMKNGFTASDFWLFLSFWFLGGVGITAGYHRYYAHRTHQASKLVQLFYLIFGGMTVENAVLVWASDHRYHHQFQDRQGDPYNINKGFFWAHMKWMFFKTPEDRPYANSPDLRKDPLVMWQQRNYLWIVTIMTFIVPTLIGAYFGRPFGGFLWGGVLRMVIFHHCTFLVNSASHVWGKKTYSEANTARDNFFLAFFTFGEGHHSFHHAFPNDHRIGYRWFHYDPGKWFIRSMARMGLVWDLKKHPNVKRVADTHEVMLAS